MEETKNAMANGQPNRPALYTSSCGEVNGDATIKATMGAQGIVLLIMPRMMAMVPHEHSGVPTDTAVAPMTPARR
jgi:hypothetical protein